MAESLKTLPPDVAAAFARGSVIEAIKLLRGKYNVGLAEARALLEALQKQAGAQATATAGKAKAKAQAQAKHEHHIPTGMKPGLHHPHTADTLHIDPHLSPGEVPRTSSGALFAAVLVAVLFVLGVSFYFGT